MIMKGGEMMKEKILIVEDEHEIADLLELYLSNDEYNVIKIDNGKDVLNNIDSLEPDLLILDIMLPDTNGFEVCKKIREKYFFPIIMLTSKMNDEDKIMGLTVGADDYITKPFNPLEVVARVKTQLRRFQKYNHFSDVIENNEYDIRGLVINKKTHKCFIYGEEIFLTPIEFSILLHLCQNQGRVVSSEELFQAVWKEKYLNNNTVMAHIARMREKMNDSVKEPKFIKTVWGVGYEID